jgi:hypothetical protein
VFAPAVKLRWGRAVRRPLFSHVALDLNAIGVADQPVKDGVGDGRIADELGAAVDGELPATMTERASSRSTAIFRKSSRRGRAAASNVSVAWSALLAGIPPSSSFNAAA